MASASPSISSFAMNPVSGRKKKQVCNPEEVLQQFALQQQNLRLLCRFSRTLSATQLRTLAVVPEEEPVTLPVLLECSNSSLFGAAMVMVGALSVSQTSIGNVKVTDCSSRTDSNCKDADAVAEPLKVTTGAVAVVYPEPPPVIVTIPITPSPMIEVAVAPTPSPAI